MFSLLSSAVTFSWILWTVTVAEAQLQHGSIGGAAAAAGGTDGACPSDLFRCQQEIAPGKWCISQAWVCDGEKDCPNGSDEQADCPAPTCPSNRFQCVDRLTCIPQGWLCDGEPDCSDGSDEATDTCRNYKKTLLGARDTGQEEPFVCPPGQYLCHDSRLCVRYDVFCNGRFECPNRDDEGTHCWLMGCMDRRKCPSQGSHCAETAEGPECYCDTGYFYNQTTKACEDLDECAYESFCDQLCDNREGSVVCRCQRDNYQLDEDDHRTCRAINEPPSKPALIVMSDSRGMYTIGYPNALTAANITTDQAVVFDIDFDSNSICMLREQTESQQLKCVDVDNSSVTATIDIQYPVTAVAHDWLSENWYLTDEKHERIVLCNKAAESCVTLLNTQLKGPKAIAVDAIKGYLFFTTLGETPKLERCLLDGSGRTVLVRDKQIVRPTYLALDFANEHVYWADSYLERIERVNYDGSGRKLIIRYLQNIHGLDVFENSLLVISQPKKVVPGSEEETTENGMEHSNMTYSRLMLLPIREEVNRSNRTMREKVPKPGPLKVFHRQKQPKFPGDDKHPCEAVSCEHICVLLRGEGSQVSAQCICQAGYKQDDQEKTKCTAILPADKSSVDPFLIYSNEKLGEVKGISIIPGETQEVMAPIAGLERPVAVDYDQREEYIYYSDTMKIGRQKLDGSERNDKFITAGVNTCEGIAIDWVGHNIFWTDEGLKTINVASLKNPRYWKTLIDDDMSHPLAIVVNPSMRQTGGYMYWTDWVQKPSSVDAKIMRAHMDGSNREVLVKDNLQWPNGLSLDHKAGKLYWCDAYMDRIESIDLQDPTNRERIFSQPKYLKHPYGLVHAYLDSKLYFYWTEFMDGQIKRLDSVTGKVEVVRNESFPLHELRLYGDVMAQTGSSPCANGQHNCSQLCLTLPVGSVCACTNGQELGTDGATCIESENITSPVPQKCGPNEFRCTNGMCINNRWTCDGDFDCSDHSDEDDTTGQCSQRKCPDEKLMYRCANNRCIYKRWMCDGEDDCRNGEDEELAKCDGNDCTTNDMIQCPITHRCIPKSWLCDLDNDCGDGYDERNCSYNTCREDQFTCKNQRCIAQEYVCDGDNDCRDNSDEEKCRPLETCDELWYFLCDSVKKSNGSITRATCMLRQLYVCDGVDNCEDGSDEWSCTAGPDVDHEDDACELGSQFQCFNGLCVPTQLQCDGDDDCGDNSDEMECTVEEIKCAEDSYKCNNQSKCIPQNWVCDGDEDCDDGGDEKQPLCNPALACEYPNFKCATNETICVKRQKLCDGINDCPNGSDEGGLCSRDLCPYSDCEHCSMSPASFICYCPDGKRLKADNKTCEDAEPCSGWGVCSQLCVHDKYSQRHLCNCMPGYYLKKDQFTCTPTDNITNYIFFSNRHEIRRLDVQQQTYVSLVSGLRNTIALDFAYNHEPSAGPGGDHSLVFWTDVVDDKIYRGKLISNSITNIQPLVNVGLATAEGLAVDWITRHLYWVESNLDQIEVAAFDGSQRTTLIAGSMESPRAIVVDPRYGILFWSDWDASFPRIEKCSMSGGGRQMIFNVSSVQNAGWPNGLTVDYEATRLYWIDAKSDSIHTVLYDGSDHRTVLHGHEYLSHPFAISVFGNHVYWTDWRTNSLLQANKWTGEDVQVIQKTITQPFDLHVFHPKRQPIVSNPCDKNNGGCEGKAICLLGYNRTAECRCPHLHKLAPSNKSCEFDGTFLLFSKKQEIRGVDLQSYFNVIPALTVPYVYNPLALDYHMELAGAEGGEGRAGEGATQRLYWVDDDVIHGVFGIHSAFLNGTGFKTIIDSALPNPRGFAIDWIADNMYFSWFTASEAAIEVSQLSGAYRSTVLSTGTIEDGQATLRMPSYIVLHPTKGYIFWADMSDGSVNRAEMDGSNPTLIHKVKTGLQPQSLTIDYSTNRLWWVTVVTSSAPDSAPDSASSSTLRGQLVHSALDGSDIKQLPPDLGVDDLGPISALAVYEGTVYFSTAGPSPAINRVNTDGEDFKFLRTNTPGISAIKMFVSKRNKQDSGSSSGCVDGGGCSQLCLPREDGERTCRCTVGFRAGAGEEEGTCEGITSFLMFSNKTEIQGLLLPADMEDNGPNANHLALAPISNIVTATAIDFHAKEDYIYWVDSTARKISRIKRDLTEREVLIEDRMIGVEGLAIDWLTNNMYWTDQVMNVIEVARTDGSNRYVVIHENVTKPGSIVVHPEEGLLIWAEAGLAPRLMKAGLDGSGAKVLTSGQIVRPYGLTINYDEGSMGTLYWCDQTLNSIEKITLDLPHTRTQVANNVTDCRGITVFQNTLYWIDISRGNGAIYMSANNGQGTHTEVMTGLQNQVRDLKMFHKDRQPSAQGNMCSSGDNGGCEELCFYTGNSGGGSRCQCAHGHLDSKTEKTCTDYDEFIAFSTVTSIVTVHMAGNTSEPNAPHPDVSDKMRMKNVIGLTFDHANKRYFFSDIQRGDIQTVGFHGGDFRTVVESVGSAEGLAYDPIFQELYWTSYTNSSISRITVSRVMDDWTKTVKPQKVIQLGPEDHPRAIAIDSCHSRMYWTNWKDKAASIQSSFLSGYDLKAIITTDIQSPNGLTLDYKAQKLYWCDARLDKIERCDLDGGNRKVIGDVRPQHAFGLTVFGEDLYWTDWVLRGVVRVNKYTGLNNKYMYKNVPRQPMGIVAVSDEALTCKRDPCYYNNGGCQGTCTVDEYHVRHCGCQDGYELQDNGVTCAVAETQEPCMSDEFTCRDGTCIDFSLTCDGRSHCIDGSDETESYCRSRVCPTGFFHCSNNRCILQWLQCNHDNDCGDNSDERKCGCRPEDEFRCGDGSCILQRYHCDHDKDCPDASDEKDCPPTDCSVYGQHARMIPCNSTTACIMPSWQCDGHDDCWDNSDEEDCETTPGQRPSTCDEQWFQCAGSGDCIPGNWHCDGDYDCSDKSDEQNCTYKCSDNHFQCADGAGAECIPLSWQCDGRDDCLDKSDEVGCTEEVTCHSNEFTCESGQKKCILLTWLCDGEKDCTEGEDELPSSGCEPMPCDEDEFQCDNYRCIRKSFLCDKDDDCGDQSDEPNSCVYETCNPETQFTCRNIHQCVPAAAHCNGTAECFDSTDEAEEECGGGKDPCGSEQKFMCNNGVCISNSNVCDNFNDCGDSSDEVLCGINECEPEEGPCDHGAKHCKDLPIGFKCTCENGWTLKEDGRTCMDINECETIYPCTHYCFNAPGSYRCSCAENFTLGADKQTCKADHFQPLLLVSNRYYIRNMMTDGMKIDLVAMDLNNAVALDFDWEGSKIYWSDVTSGGSNITSMDFNGGNRTVIHSSTLRNPDGIAVDWLGRNLYWCDKTTDTIEVSTLTGLYRKVLLKENLQEPRALAVHPFRGWLFYTDWGDNAHIGRLGMDGSQVTQLVTEKLGWPNALTIDYITDHIYWADARLDYICMADLDGQNPRYIIRGGSSNGHLLPHVFALSVFEDFLYWTDWEHMAVKKAHKYSGQNITKVTSMIHRPMDVQVFHPYRQLKRLKKEQENPCENNGGCATGALCLIKPGGTARTCVCPERHYLSQDKSTCISNCTSSEYLCKNMYKCIPFWWRCDGQNDCGDKSDEPDTCPTYFCKHPGLFQCSNATSSFDCISPTQICDGMHQCVDKSDEVSCATHTCLDSQFKCSNPPKCIPKTKRCDSNFDCDDHSDEKDCPLYTCTANQFQCENKRCIPYVWRCDRDNDCGDGTDEPDNCQDTECVAGYIKCNKSGRCVPATWKCDGDKDCGDDDDSDEPPEICHQSSCQPTYFKCANTRCIPGRWQCDYDDDCRDGSDELNCDMRNCSESEWPCRDGRCIRKEFVCDGSVQCLDGSDEHDNCTVKCHADQFKCGTGKHCVPNAWKCDQEPDCADASDENDCSVEAVNCTAGEFKCGNGMCIPSSWQCDGDNDCFDAQDEDPEECSNYACPVGYFRCPGVPKCIPPNHVCDGVPHCPNDADEDTKGVCREGYGRYGPPGACRKDEFRCLATGHCIPKLQRCDAYSDCVDGSDEQDCFRICQKDFGCALGHEVCDLADGRDFGQCVCPPDYERNITSGQCEVINKCLIHGTCSQHCVFKPPHHGHEAKFHCQCEENFVKVGGGKASDGTMCVANGTKPYLVSITENEILAFHVIQRSGLYQKLFTSEQSTESTMRFDSVSVFGMDQQIFLTDHHTPAIWTYSLPASLDTSKRGRRAVEAGLESSLKRLPIPEGAEPRGIAVDWVAQNLYWSDSKSGKIYISTLDGSVHRTLIDTNLDHPYALLIDPVGRLYWALWGNNAKIESCRLDGSDRRVFINEDVEWPAGLALDFPNRRMYWTDPKRRTIESVNMDGSYRHTVKVFAADEEPPFKIDVFEDKVYYSTFKTHDVYYINKLNASEPPTLLVRGLARIGDVLLMQEFKQKSYANDTTINPCSSNPCVGEKSLCLNVPNAAYNTSYSCLCPEDFVASPDGQCEHSGRVDVNSCEEPAANTYCFNNGTCHIKEDGTLKCSCLLGYYGSRCQKNVCYNFCLNGGECVPTGRDKAKCNCPYKYTGDRCDSYQCDNYCSKKGLCTVSKITQKPKCKCEKGFTGEHCETLSHDFCVGHTCRNGGDCYLELDTRPRCNCTAGFTGEHCEMCAFVNGTRYKCNSHEESYCYYGATNQPHCNCPVGYKVVSRCSPGHPHNCSEETCEAKCTGYCMNGGTCSYDDTQQPRCTCPPRYTSQRCTVDRCAAGHCTHGECFERNNELVCDCDEGWTGPHCNKSLAECRLEVNPCFGNSKCIPDSAGNFKHCVCPLGYRGTTCSLLEGCSIINCEHGGSCVHEGSNFVCKCPSGWTGETCGVAVPPQCSEYCHNGGQCRQCDVTGASPRCTLCRCEDAYMGEQCNDINTKMNHKGASTNVVAIVVSLLLVLALLLLVVIGAIYYKRRHNSQFKHQRMAADGSNMEISNPIYMKDYDDEDADGFSFDGDKPTNFSNPMYDTLYNESSSDLQPESEKKQLLKSKDPKLTFYGEDEPPDSSSFA